MICSDPMTVLKEKHGQKLELLPVSPDTEIQPSLQSQAIQMPQILLVMVSLLVLVRHQEKPRRHIGQTGWCSVLGWLDLFAIPYLLWCLQAANFLMYVYATYTEANSAYPKTFKYHTKVNQMVDGICIYTYFEDYAVTQQALRRVK